jgi:hypothetical protein
MALPEVESAVRNSRSSPSTYQVELESWGIVLKISRLPAAEIQHCAGKPEPTSGVYVIADDAGDKPRADLKRPWDLITAYAELEGVRIHDLRHTHASIGAGAGLGLPMIGKLLGHRHAETTARYAHLDADPLRKASNQIAQAIVAAMGKEQSAAEIVPFSRRAS